MAMLYFDGFDQYNAVAAVVSPDLCTFADGLNNQQTVATDPTIPTPNANAMFVKIAGDDSVWRCPATTPAWRSSVGSSRYDFQRGLGTYSSSTSGYAHTINALKPLSEQKKLVLGFKIKHAAYNYNLSSTNWLPLAVFSPTANFTDTAKMWAVCVGGSSQNAISILATDSTAQQYYHFLGKTPFPAGTFTADSDPLLGRSSFAASTAGNTLTRPCSPSVEILASNTVEIEVTDAGKVTVWINNQYVGSATFANLDYISDIQYIKTNFIVNAFAYSNTTVVSEFGFFGITDMYLLNGLGTRNTSRLGKVKVVTRSAERDIAVQFQRPETSATNASVAASLPPTVGKSLIGAKEGDKDLYGSSGFKFTTETIAATSVTTSGYKTDPTGNDIAPILNVSGTDYVGNTNVVPISTTRMKTEQAIYETNPKTGKPFTKAELDATTFGVTVVAPIVTEE